MDARIAKNETGREEDGNKRSFAWCDHGSLSGLPPRETLDSGGSLTTFGNDTARRIRLALQKVLPFQLIGQLPFGHAAKVRRIRRGQERTIRFGIVCPP